MSWLLNAFRSLFRDDLPETHKKVLEKIDEAIQAYFRPESDATFSTIHLALKEFDELNRRKNKCIFILKFKPS